MRVLVATDGSTCAGIAVDLVAGLHWPAGTEILAFEAIASGVQVFGGPWPPIAPMDTATFDGAIRDQAAHNLRDAAERLAGPGRSVETAAVSGRAGDAIVSRAGAWGADVVVVGSRGHGKLETMLLGSVSSEVVDHAQAAVLVARGRQVRRAVFAWDGSDRAEAALPALTEWGLFDDLRVDVLSVADADPPWWVSAGLVDDATAADAYVAAAEPSRRQHEALAHEMADRLRAAGLQAIPATREGDPAESIVAFARAKAADLVVLGTHGRTGLQRLLMGSVARNVLFHASCSVLLAR